MGIFSAKSYVRARFYGSLAAAIDAGLPPDQALTLATSHDPMSSRVTPGQVTSSQSLSENLIDGSGPFESFEIQAIQAGERAGRLPEVLQRMGRYFQARGQAMDRLGTGLLYPVILLHGAILLPPLFILFRDGVASYLSAVGPLLILLYGVVGIGWGFFRKLERFALAVPLGGNLARHQSLADFAHLFAILFAAGIPLPRALDQAARANRLTSVRAAGQRAASAVRRGATLGEGLAGEDQVFARAFVATIHIGEVAGKLEESLEQAARMAQEEADQALRRLVVGMPALAFATAVGVVAWVVFGFWTM